MFKCYDCEATFFEPRNTTERVELNKFCKFCQKHTTHKETK